MAGYEIGSGGEIPPANEEAFERAKREREVDKQFWAWHETFWRSRFESRDAYHRAPDKLLRDAFRAGVRCGRGQTFLAETEQPS